MITIYKIIDNTSHDVYIGSTGQVLKYRMRAHSHTNNVCKSKIIIDRGDWDYIVLEECNPEERKIREQYYIDTIEHTVNKNNLFYTRHAINQIERRAFVKSFGGDIRAENCNLLKISLECFA
tara:strand:+ start:694 stop:1059 length:366 start_codon:yes stop_codon:yes gene_type:complete